jgi:hypothetical protein
MDPDPAAGSRAGPTRNILETKRKAFTDEQMEALLYYYGEFFGWPPHPTPHVRSTAELNETVPKPDSRYIDAKGRLVDPHALFRTSKSGKRDWYPPSGRSASVETYLPAVERLVEVGSLTLRLVWRFCDQLGVRDYVAIDEAFIQSLTPMTPARYSSADRSGRGKVRSSG